MKQQNENVYVTLQELFQQVYVKYGVMCERAELSNGTLIQSILDIPSNARVLNLISEDFISKEYV